MKEKFSIRLKKALDLKNIKPIELAEKTGIPKSSISEYLKDKYEPKSKAIYLIAKELNINEGWLLGLEDVPMERIPICHKGVKIRVLNKIIAEVPIDTAENIIGYEEIPNDMAQNGNFFALKIKSDNMQPEIKIDDIVIVKQQSDCNSGEIAVVLINQHEATVNKVIKNNNSIILQPLNNNYDSLMFDSEQIKKIPVKIIGKVVEVRRIFEKRGGIENE